MKRLADERGTVSTFVAVITVAMLMAAGLAVDGGRKIAALREATHIADNAARAGAQAIDVDTLRTTGVLLVEPDEATTKADAYLASLGHSGQIQVSADTVTVTVSITVDTVLLPLAHITVTATETVAAVNEEPG